MQDPHCTLLSDEELVKELEELQRAELNKRSDAARWLDEGEPDIYEKKVEVSVEECSLGADTPNVCGESELYGVGGLVEQLVGIYVADVRDERHEQKLGQSKSKIPQTTPVASDVKTETDAAEQAMDTDWFRSQLDPSAQPFFPGAFAKSDETDSTTTSGVYECESIKECTPRSTQPAPQLVPVPGRLLLGDEWFSKALPDDRAEALEFDRDAYGKEAKEELMRMQFAKTDLCRFYKANRCRKGDSCPFAHGKEDVRGRPNLTKTSLCRPWMKKRCPLPSSDCPFAHGVVELRATVEFQRAAAKVKAQRV